MPRRIGWLCRATRSAACARWAGVAAALNCCAGLESLKQACLRQRLPAHRVRIHGTQPHPPPSHLPPGQPSPQIFRFIDADHDGEISMHDLSVALQHAGLDWEQQGVVRLLAGLDLARDGTVSGHRSGGPARAASGCSGRWVLRCTRWPAHATSWLPGCSAACLPACPPAGLSLLSPWRTLPRPAARCRWRSSSRRPWTSARCSPPRTSMPSSVGATHAPCHAALGCMEHVLLSWPWLALAAQPHRGRRWIPSQQAARHGSPSIPALAPRSPPAAELDRDRDGLLSVRELKEALEECRISIASDTLGRLMQREGALDAKGMLTAKSFAVGAPCPQGLPFCWLRLRGPGTEGAGRRQVVRVACWRLAWAVHACGACRARRATRRRLQPRPAAACASRPPARPRPPAPPRCAATADERGGGAAAGAGGLDAGRARVLWWAAAASSGGRAPVHMAARLAACRGGTHNPSARACRAPCSRQRVQAAGHAGGGAPHAGGWARRGSMLSSWASKAGKPMPSKAQRRSTRRRCSWRSTPAARLRTAAARPPAHPRRSPAPPPRPRQPHEVEGLRQLFQHLDEEATGTISAQQLGEALRHMGKQVGARAWGVERGQRGGWAGSGSALPGLRWGGMHPAARHASPALLPPRLHRPPARLIVACVRLCCCPPSLLPRRSWARASCASCWRGWTCGRRV